MDARVFGVIDNRNRNLSERSKYSTPWWKNMSTKMITMMNPKTERYGTRFGEGGGDYTQVSTRR